MRLDNNQLAFLELLRAGLWEKESRLSQFGDIDYDAILQLAEEQSVVGLVTAGFEHVVDVKVPQEWVLQFVGETLQIEQQNKDMNGFVGRLIDKLRKEDVYAILVKGQGIAQCYERPQWRCSGDIDLLLSDTSHKKAKDCLLPLASSVEEEDPLEKHLGLIIDTWSVELHGTLRSLCLSKMDKVIDERQRDLFYGGKVRSWLNGCTQVFLPSPDNDVIFVFTHILKHFFRGGIGLRQVCDWIRLIWTFREDIGEVELEKNLSEAKIMSEWNAFAALAVSHLGMPADAMSLYSDSPRWKKKADKVLQIVLETGNFGHNIDRSYMYEYGAFRRKMTTLWRGTFDNARHSLIFPTDSVKVWFNLLKRGFRH